MTSRPISSMRLPLLLLIACSVVGCVVEKQVLDEPPGPGGVGGSAGSRVTPSMGGTVGGRQLPTDGGTAAAGKSVMPIEGGTGGTMPDPVLWVDCLDALQGADGDACTPEAFPCEFQQGCRTLFAACLPAKETASAFQLTLGTKDSCAVMCARDEDCEKGSWCGDGTCVTCQPEQACAPGWSLVDRNGCNWCVPPTQCRDDTACAGGRCFAGYACPPGCAGDAKCCYGNLCVADGCPPPYDVDCSVVGCKPGTHCVSSDPAKCYCDASTSSRWVCSPEANVSFCK